MIKRIGILTSGGDAPGMNAAIRAVVRTAIFKGLEVYGIRYGYQGMIEGDIYKMETQDVSNIIQRGGTILKSARSNDFRTIEGRQKAFEQLQKFGIEGLILIGGDGTFTGAVQFFKEHQIPCVGIPGTIDKDMSGTDYTIGFDTAVNTAIDAIDKIRDTADAHDRLFVIEVMGRDAGYIALNSGIATGAEDILIPERITNVGNIIERINYDVHRKKNVHIIVVAEGDDFGAGNLTHILSTKYPQLEVRHAVLGHIQRGGSPTYFDRVKASKFGYHAVLSLLAGKNKVMIGSMNDKIVETDFEQVIKKNHKIDQDLLDMVKILSQ